MKKRLAAVMLSFTTVLALSGCYPTGKKVNEDISSTSKNAGEDISDTSSDSSHFEYIKDNLTVSFDYPEIPDELPSRIKLKKKMFNRQEMVELFFNGEEPVSEYLYGVNKEYGQYTANDGSELTIEGNSISYINGKISSWESSDKLKFPVSYFSVTNVCKEYMRDIYSITGDEIEGFPLQEALDSAKELISKLGITGYGEPKIYSFSLSPYEKMKSNETYMFNDEYPLTKDNEIYIFVFPQLFGKVEVSNLRGVLIKNSADDMLMILKQSRII